MFLQILRSLERFATELALVRLERNMNSDVRGYVIALDCGGAALTPCAGEVKVVSTGDRSADCIAVARAVEQSRGECICATQRRPHGLRTS